MRLVQSKQDSLGHRGLYLTARITAEKQLLRQLSSLLATCGMLCCPCTTAADSRLCSALPLGDTVAGSCSVGSNWTPGRALKALCYPPDIGKWCYLLKLPLREVGEGRAAAAGLWTLDSECVHVKRIPEAHSICA
ncbi:Voltage-Dependent L-Type Calcium Channel Subunit Alpha-1F [Manis pentadactyla]|nr:Voltage-Dependent L-Type Calcium Channel Subunit Alpha-1F [Manis pentadactyla]